NHAGPRVPAARSRRIGSVPRARSTATTPALSSSHRDGHPPPARDTPESAPPHSSRAEPSRTETIPPSTAEDAAAAARSEGEGIMDCVKAGTGGERMCRLERERERAQQRVSLVPLPAARLASPGKASRLVLACLSSLPGKLACLGKENLADGGSPPRARLARVLTWTVDLILPSQFRAPPPLIRRRCRRFRLHYRRFDLRCCRFKLRHH
ncbi:unnamed protein product, partial [Urochloa humidicola]